MGSCVGSPRQLAKISSTNVSAINSWLLFSYTQYSRSVSVERCQDTINILSSYFILLLIFFTTLFSALFCILSLSHELYISTELKMFGCHFGLTLGPLS